MNERVRELAEQAVNSISDHIDFDIPDVFKEKFTELIVQEMCHVIDADCELQYGEGVTSNLGEMPAALKFAELIVRECAGIDFRLELGLSSDQDYEVGQLIKLHFGVEE